MELMDTSLDKFYKKVLEKKKTIPEDILGKMAVSVSACATPPPLELCALLMLCGFAEC